MATRVNPTGTNTVAAESILKRRKWLKEKMLQESANSFWDGYKGHTRDSVIHVVNDISAREGHNVIFDMDGKLAGRPVTGKQQAAGTGEQKRKFSDSVTVDIVRLTVDNGTKYDAVDINNLEGAQHSDSRAKLADLWVRCQDQAYFDLGQQNSEFGITLTDNFEFDDFLQFETIVKTGTGFTTAKQGFTYRAPLEPFKTTNGRRYWILVVDVYMKQALLSKTGAQSLLAQADVRGNQNRLIKGVIGTIGSFIVVEAPLFNGITYGNTIMANGYYNFNASAVYDAGLKQYKSNDNGSTKVWAGDPAFNTSSHPLYSRGLILGSGAFQFAMGQEPDYDIEYRDFKMVSESCLTTWCGAKSTKLYAENEDYESIKLAGYNYGSVFVDLKVRG